MVLERQRAPLVEREVTAPDPRDSEVRIRVECCGVCRTDLHVVDGELRDPKLPLILGHQIAGVVESSRSEAFKAGDRVGVPWLGWTCGKCRYCLAGQENLCDYARFTGYTIDGGYADLAVADTRFCFALPKSYSAAATAPLLCAGLIGFRAYRMAGDGRRLGFYGFGSAAQILVQLARADGREVFAFTRDGDAKGQRFAREMGAAWAGGSSEHGPQALDAAIIFAPAGPLVVKALENVRKGGVVVCAGIHMSDIPSFRYELLWGERVVRSVANLTRRDGLDFFARIGSLQIETKRTMYPLARANEALSSLRSGEITGSAVLEVSAEY